MSLHGRILNSLYLMLIVIFFYYDQNILNSICVRFNRNLMIEEKSLNNLKEINKSNKKIKQLMTKAYRTIIKHMPLLM